MTLAVRSSYVLFAQVQNQLWYLVERVWLDYKKASRGWQTPSSRKYGNHALAPHSALQYQCWRWGRDKIIHMHSIHFYGRRGGITIHKHSFHLYGMWGGKTITRRHSIQLYFYCCRQQRVTRSTARHSQPLKTPTSNDHLSAISLTRSANHQQTEYADTTAVNLASHVKLCHWYHTKPEKEQ